MGSGGATVATTVAVLFAAAGSAWFPATKPVARSVEAKAGAGTSKITVAVAPAARAPRLHEVSPDPTHVP
jgi:hypothetical protein